MRGEWGRVPQHRSEIQDLLLCHGTDPSQARPPPRLRHDVAENSDTVAIQGIDHQSLGYDPATTEVCKNRRYNTTCSMGCVLWRRILMHCTYCTACEEIKISGTVDIQASSALSSIVALTSQPTKMASKLEDCTRAKQGWLAKTGAGEHLHLMLWGGTNTIQKLENPRGSKTTFESLLLKAEECLELIPATQGLLQSSGRWKLATHAKRAMHKCQQYNRWWGPLAPLAASGVSTWSLLVYHHFHH